MAEFSWIVVEPAPALAPAAAPATGGEGAPRDLLMDADGDLAEVQGDLATARGMVALAQSLRMRLRFFQGEWFLDASVGLPYFQSILVKNPNAPAVRAAFRERILGTPGVDALTSLTLNYRAADRSLDVAFAVTTALGELNVRLQENV